MRNCPNCGAPFPEGVFTRGMVIVLILMGATVGAILGRLQGVAQGINETLPALRKCAGESGQEEPNANR